MTRSPIATSSSSKERQAIAKSIPRVDPAPITCKACDPGGPLLDEQLHGADR